MLSIFENIEVKSGKNEIKVQGGTIKNLVVSETAKNAKADLAEGVKVTKAEINAPAKIGGKGELKDARVNSNGVTIIAPTTGIVKSAEGVDKVEITKPETTKPSGRGGGGSSKASEPDSDENFKWSKENARSDWWKEKQANEILVKGTGAVNPEPEKKVLMSIRY